MWLVMQQRETADNVENREVVTPSATTTHRRIRTSIAICGRTDVSNDVVDDEGDGDGGDGGDGSGKDDNEF